MTMYLTKYSKQVWSASIMQSTALRQRNGAFDLVERAAMLAQGSLQPSRHRIAIP